MEKRRLIREIQDFLGCHQVRITQADLDLAFRSLARGRYNTRLFGVWSCRSVSGMVFKLKRRGFMEESLSGGQTRLFLPRPTRHESRQNRGVFSLATTSSLNPPHQRGACSGCGYVDPDWPQASHCPNCGGDTFN